MDNMKATGMVSAIIINPTIAYPISTSSSMYYSVPVIIIQAHYITDWRIACYY